MKRGLSKIFGGALKFHKNLKGGLYFALLMYSNDEKVLVTVDDYLPIVEVSESFNSQTIKQDFLWLSKVRPRTMCLYLVHFENACFSAVGLHMGKCEEHV